MGFTEFYWVSFVFSWVLLGPTGLTGFYWVLLGFVGFSLSFGCCFFSTNNGG